MQKTNQAIAVVKREVQLAEWQQQIQTRQEQGLTVDEWCIGLGTVRVHTIIDLRRFVNICVKEWVLWKTPRKTA